MSNINKIIYEVVNGIHNQLQLQLNHKFGISNYNPHLNVRPLSTDYQKEQNNLSQNIHKQPINQRTQRAVSTNPITPLKNINNPLGNIKK